MGKAKINEMGIGCALYLNLDESIQKLLSRLNDELGIRTVFEESGQRLHLTLCNGDSGNTEKFIEETSKLSGYPKQITLNGTAVFATDRGNVGHIAISRSDKDSLKESYDYIFQSAQHSEIIVRSFCQPKAWIPHISLAARIPDSQILAFAELGKGLKNVSCKIVGHGVAT